MTPYTERRHSGYYNEKGELPASTTTDDLGGLGSPASSPAAEDSAEPALDDLTKSELLEKAKTLGVSPANNAMTKDELVAALEEHKG